MKSEKHSHLVETLIDGAQMYRGKLLDVRLDRVRLANGVESTREYVKHQGAVVVIPLLENGKMIFDLLHNLARTEDTTIIAVTHDLEIAGKTDQTFTLVDGKLEKKGMSNKRSVAQKLGIKNKQ